ncbi:MAG TPA: entericidin A/B family lipoprotein [Casimicrobiaceae bacterium]|jgi:predicted small secreted protein
MKRLIALVIAASFAALATGCNTMQGMGKDVEKGGEKIQKESIEHKNY